MSTRTGCSSNKEATNNQLDRSDYFKIPKTTLASWFNVPVERMQFCNVDWRFEPDSAHP